MSSWGVMLRFLRGGRCLRQQSIAPISQARLAQRTGLSQDRISRLERGSDIGLSEAMALRNVLVPWMGVEQLHRVACEMEATPIPTHDRIAWREWFATWEARLSGVEPAVQACEVEPSSAQLALPGVAPDAEPRTLPAAQACEVEPSSAQLALPGVAPDAEPRTLPAVQACEVEPEEQDELPPPSPVDRAMMLTRKIRAATNGVEMQRAWDERYALVEAMTEAEYERYSRLMQGR